jgi:endonuclease/exonuclease/phosphatase family metal-dependent hydrolase
VKLTLSRDVWVADLLWAHLREQRGSGTSGFVVGGDFNLSETFDSWRGGSRGNAEYLARMRDLGFTECLRHHSGKLTPTFRNPRGGKLAHQMDHLFVDTLAKDLVHCRTGEAARVFDVSMSDHLPIIAELGDGR